MGHCVLLLQHISTHMHFIKNGYKRFSKTNSTDPRQCVPLNVSSGPGCQCNVGVCILQNLTGNHLSILHVLRKMDNTQKDGASTSAAKMDASSGLMMNWNIVDLLSQSVYEKYWAVSKCKNQIP